LSLLKYTPPLFMHHSQHLFQFWKHSWNDSFAILCSSAENIFESPRQTQVVVLSVRISAWWREGLVSTEAGGQVSSHFLWENHKSEGRNALEHWHDGVTIYFPSKNQAFFSSLPLSAFSSPADNIPCSPFGHKVEVYDELHPHNHKTQHHFHIGPNLLCFFGSGLRF